MVARFKIIAFLSTLSLRRATNSRSQQAQRWPYFYPRSPCGERPVKAPCMQVIFNISIHALLAESDPIPQTSLVVIGTFLSTLSLRRATSITCKCRPAYQKFLSTLSLRRATFGRPQRQFHRQYFYPRSPCGERLFAIIKALIFQSISIHALLAESDLLLTSCMPVSGGFLSTLSLRRATTPARMSSRLLVISIHALLAESDALELTNTMLYA